MIKDITVAYSSLLYAMFCMMLYYLLWCFVLLYAFLVFVFFFVLLRYATLCYMLYCDILCYLFGVLSRCIMLYYALLYLFCCCHCCCNLPLFQSGYSTKAKKHIVILCLFVGVNGIRFVFCFHECSAHS